MVIALPRLLVLSKNQQ